MENQIESRIGRPFRPHRPRADFEYGYYSEFPVTYTPIRAGTFNLYLNGPIEDVSQFIGHIEAFQVAGENDIVNLHLSTPGGSMDATDTFLQAMHNCEARVIVHASGGCHSCGSIILLHADEYTLSENFNSLIHNGSAGAYGDYNKFVASAKHSAEYMSKVMRQTFEGFLAPDELEAMLDGKDFWLDRHEWVRRWNNRQELFKAKMQQAQQMIENFVTDEELMDEEEPQPEISRGRSRRRK